MLLLLPLLGDSEEISQLKKKKVECSFYVGNNIIQNKNKTTLRPKLKFHQQPS